MFGFVTEMRGFLVLYWVVAAVKGVSDKRDCSPLPMNNTKSYFVCLFELSKLGRREAALKPVEVTQKNLTTALPPNQSSHQQIQSEFQKNIIQRHLAILVPFRNCFRKLLEFVNHMHKFLNKQNMHFHTFIIQQSDNNRFNRASLINVGFLYTKGFDYIAIHDIDLLPINESIKYEYPVYGPIHIMTLKHYNNFGRIILMTSEHFIRVDGLSNNYWGYQEEDDEFYRRFKNAGLTVIIHNISTKDNFKDVGTSLWAKKGVSIRHICDQREYLDQQSDNHKKRDKKSGLHNVNYGLRGIHNIVIDNQPITLINVELICDIAATPWCQCRDQAPPKAGVFEGMYTKVKKLIAGIFGALF